MEFQPAKTSVIDHLNFDAADEGDHTLIAANNFNGNAKVIFGMYFYLSMKSYFCLVATQI